MFGLGVHIQLSAQNHTVAAGPLGFMQPQGHKAPQGPAPHLLAPHVTILSSCGDKFVKKTAWKLALCGTDEQL